MGLGGEAVGQRQVQVHGVISCSDGGPAWSGADDRLAMSSPHTQHVAPELGEALLRDRRPRGRHQLQRPGDVVEGQQARRRRFGDAEQVAQVATAVAGAHRARARASTGTSSSPWRAALTWTLPDDVSAVPWRPRRVCSTQSNWSTPRAIASTSDAGSPTPIR